MTLTYLREESVNRKFSVVAGGKQGGDQESDLSVPTDDQERDAFTRRFQSSPRLVLSSVEGKNIFQALLAEEPFIKKI